MDDRLLEVRRLKKYFPVTKGLITMRIVANVKAVDGIDFHVNRGDTFGLVGESGCGKTTTAKVMLLLEKPTQGQVLLEGKDVFSLKGEALSRYKSTVQPVFQDPFSALNPRMRVADIVAEPIVTHGHPGKAVVTERVSEVLRLVGLHARSANLYPHEFSGGQRQRIAIARALICNPKCIILDEPVSALDVSIRAQIMNLLKRLQAEHGLTYVLIAHDLAVVKHMSTRIGVMYLGKVMETARSEELYRKPLHPYTRALFSAVLPAHPDERRHQIVLRGEVPSPLAPPPGCRLHPRCSEARAICSELEPPLKDVGNDHQVACHNF